jgi:hypothetical protein
MLCTSCHFDLGAAASGLCPNCGAATGTPEATDAKTTEADPTPDTDADLVVAPRARRRLPWGTLIIGCASFALALQGLVWLTRQAPPHVMPDVVAPTAPPPLTEPDVVSPEPPPPVDLPPSPEPSPRVSPEPPLPVDVPPSAPVAPNPPVSDWMSEMRQALDQCRSIFCQERVRWKYCNHRWNSVPECVTGQEGFPDP